MKKEKPNSESGRRKRISEEGGDAIKETYSTVSRSRIKIRSHGKSKEYENTWRV